MPTNAMGQAAATAASRGISGRSSSGAGGGVKGGGGILGKPDGPGKYSSAGGGVSPGKGGEKLIGKKISGVGGKRYKTLWDKASAGEFLTDEEQAELSGEQLAWYLSQRAAALFG